ncbi:MAG: MGMT family protein [Planctomycetota bacterium]
MDHWLIKTSWGWCGLITDRDTIKTIILPSDNKSLILRRFGKNCNSLFVISGSLNEQQTKNYKLRPHILRFLKDLNHYFNGEKVDFGDTKILTSYPSRNSSGRYKIDLRDSSDFEKAVYKVLRTISYGTIRPYKWVAEKVGCPKGSRAVGNALAKNPLPLIIPCHRVVRSNGSLGSFSAIGGVKLKKRLLETEGAI